jgi:hypothetical protein
MGIVHGVFANLALRVKKYEYYGTLCFQELPAHIPRGLEPAEHSARVRRTNPCASTLQTMAMAMPQLKLNYFDMHGGVLWHGTMG